MPELPEIEIIKQGLSKLLPGRIIADVWHDWQKSFPNAPADVARFLVDAKIISVKRRAKVLIIELSSGYSLVIHLKMTGQLVFVPKTSEQKAKSQKQKAEKKFGGGHPTDSLINDLPDKSTRVVIDFTDEPKLYFNDQRKFGWMRLLPTVEVPQIDFMKKVGPEPLEDDFTVGVFIERLNRRKSSSIKAVLLDQTVLAGVGNIYADESLFAAKIHPATPVFKVSKAKLVMLHNALRQILRTAIDKGGSTDRNYVDAKGKKGSYLSFAQVFRREGQPCPRCGTEIIKIRVANRGTHICPKCQER
ncbi:bifunctional DNA-formamidopyrimidine glycosylase/DNA-(apurinic or apyrimidinic site) lyase [Candidatus Saccharibacteria bacterium]|nr:bifunctional DNA-formamidopyrimidine glycosylase/DNA-(apurinic or apyrimidinic site) lyase [Candidatus Saccharibacteria bacterium]